MSNKLTLLEIQKHITVKIHQKISGVQDITQYMIFKNLEGYVLGQKGV